MNSKRNKEISKVLQFELLEEHEKALKEEKKVEVFPNFFATFFFFFFPTY